jgi:hypothetical protein
MTPRTRPYGDVEGADTPARDRPYESFGQQGVALSTYGDEPETARGAERVDLGEPVADIDPKLAAGPRGWQRRDERIHDDVCAHLTVDGYVDASDTEVIVHHGEVTLTGSVTDRAQRERAVRIAESVRGVIDVISRIHVRSSERMSAGVSDPYGREESHGRTRR